MPAVALTTIVRIVGSAAVFSCAVTVPTAPVTDVPLATMPPDDAVKTTGTLARRLLLASRA